GFLAWNWVNRLLAEGHRVIASKNLSTVTSGTFENLAGKKNSELTNTTFLISFFCPKKNSITFFISRHRPARLIIWSFQFPRSRWAHSARIIHWGWPRTKKPLSFSPRHRRCTEIHWSTHKKKITGVT